MIDHVLGRPSVKFRKYQVLAVVSFWSFYLYRGNPHGPHILRRLSNLSSKRLTAWQTMVITLLWLYIWRNSGKLVGLESPEPLANLYNRSYFRATWVTTALDAGFWTAMRIKRKWARDLLSMVFTVYYLICAEQADEKVRKVRATLTVDHLRVSWDKPTTPYISFLTRVLRPRLMKYPPRAIRIPRPAGSSYKDPVNAWLYYEGPISSLKKHDKIVLDVPGGGFVAMNPRTHDDKLLAWAGKTGLPVLSLDYRKAPEYPYPYALNECYDVYHTLHSTRGRCIGLAGTSIPKIIVAGDSAGGNLAVSMVLMLLASGSTDSRVWHGEKRLPPPIGCVLVYPALDMNIGNWMTDEQMALIRDRRMRKTNQGVLRRKSDDYRNLTPSTPHHSDDEDDTTPPLRSTTPAEGSITESPTAIHISAAHAGNSEPSKLNTTDANAASTSEAQKQTQISKPQPLKTRLAMASMISYFNDRILSPEMMRAMIILYIGPHNRPDFSTDYLLSPLLAPEQLLAEFPKTYFLTGERDPLVDDTVIFAGRIRQAKAAAWEYRREMGLLGEKGKEGFREEDWVQVTLVPGISHGFLQFVSVFPEGWKYIFRCERWMREMFEKADADEVEEGRRRDGEVEGLGSGRGRGNGGERHHRRMRTADSSGDEYDRPLEMSVASSKSPKANGTPSATSTAKDNQNERDDDVAIYDDYDGPDWADSRLRGRRGGAAKEKESLQEKRRRLKRPENRRQKSLVSLASSDDLLGRRMKGLTGGLMGGGLGEEVPPTP
ncbi:alpha/beta-hydrolase [Aulographum hederae CBS 113979]|uniref:Alpha/beta-hydrolase n=1 Tax=Aulographum hederae CBS 113979 TaxID=1176131 RepID=A0A6G1HED4_9PEZI|nr:alpha/beta-hydrolase [Aulographum hederae CBS 113979]